MEEQAERDYLDWCLRWGLDPDSTAAAVEYEIEFSKTYEDGEVRLATFFDHNYED